MHVEAKLREPAMSVPMRHPQIFREEPLRHGKRFPHEIELTDKKAIKQMAHRICHTTPAQQVVMDEQGEKMHSEAIKEWSWLPRRMTV